MTQMIQNTLMALNTLMTPTIQKNSPRLKTLLPLGKASLMRN